jgi:hypothetical protein
VGAAMLSKLPDEGHVLTNNISSARFNLSVTMAIRHLAKRLETDKTLVSPFLAFATRSASSRWG